MSRISKLLNEAKETSNMDKMVQKGVISYTSTDGENTTWQEKDGTWSIQGEINKKKIKSLNDIKKIFAKEYSNLNII